MNKSRRVDNDFLRGIAVISVIIYHAAFEIIIKDQSYRILPGGYLGVDVFYVISGYLISFLILEKINANKFNFFDFYERRARRLLPTLFLIIFLWVSLSVMDVGSLRVPECPGGSGAPLENGI